MSALEVFLGELRYRPAICALIPVGACMGIPLRLEGDILYIPFFHLISRTQCSLESELFIGYPSGEIYEYKKARKGRCFEFDEQALLKCKRALFCGKPQSPDCQEVPEDFAGIYQQAREERKRENWKEGELKNDEHPIGV